MERLTLLGALSSCLQAGGILTGTDGHRAILGKRGKGNQVARSENIQAVASE